MTDAIHIQALEVFAHIGVPEEERAKSQRLTFNLSLWPLRSLAELNDDIERAVNYAAVCDEAKSFVRERQDRLIETLADALAKLSRRDRELIALRFGADLTAAQIGERFSISTNAAEVALHRALDRLRLHVEFVDGEESGPGRVRVPAPISVSLAERTSGSTGEAT